MSIRNSMIASLFLPESFYRREVGLAYPDQAEFICPQAFGRNTYTDEHVGLAIHGILTDCYHDTIAAFQRLKMLGFQPGQPNKILAQRCIQLAKFVRPFFDESGTVKGHAITHPVIGQWEVLYAMWLIEPDWYAEHQDILFPIWPPIAGKWSTHAMMLTAFNIAEAHGLRIPLIIAHPEHIQRCFFVARKIFGIAATDHGSSGTPKEWFDRHSVQKQTQGPGRWLRYEMLARIHHRLFGWM